MISLLGLILGTLFLIAGIYTYVYYEQRLFFKVYPYRDYAPPLIILGIGLLVVGYVTGERAREEKLAVKERLVTEMVYCSYCGTRNVKDAVYCKKCGKKIS